MKPSGTFGVVGLGLIGGSLARDLAGAGCRVLAYDCDAGTVQTAVAKGVVHDVLSAELTGLAAAEVVVIAVPVDAMPRVLARVATVATRARLITDVGSTKHRIVAAAEACGLGPRFVGGHPMAGDHRGGFGASRRGLFRGARAYLCPAPSAGEPAITEARLLWQRLGAAPAFLAPAEHDALLAWSSHLPHVVASALAVALQAAGVPASELGPGGRDTTRIAASSPALWTAIARDNAAALLPALDQMAQELARIRHALASTDVVALESVFRAGQAWTEGATPGAEDAGRHEAR